MFGFLDPLPPCPHLDLIYTLKFLRLLFQDSPSDVDIISGSSLGIPIGEILPEGGVNFLARSVMPGAHAERGHLGARVQCHGPLSGVHPHSPNVFPRMAAVKSRALSLPVFSRLRALAHRSPSDILDLISHIPPPTRSPGCRFNQGFKWQEIQPKVTHEVNFGKHIGVPLCYTF